LFLQAYGDAAVITLMAIVIGRAICSAAARDQRWYAAPAVGFATLIVLEAAVIKLPGGADTAIIIEALAFVGAAAVLVANMRRQARRGEVASWRRMVTVEDGVLVIVPVLMASVPFVANGRIGLTGVNVDNDGAWHLLWAESLRSPAIAHLWPPTLGYPVGPHSLVAVVGTLTRAPLDMAFTGLLIATIPITALAGAGLIPGEPAWRRAVIGAMCSLTYLVAAYYAEAAFKETIMAALLLAFVVHLQQVSVRWSGAGTLTRWWLVAPVVLLGAAAVYTYSYVGLVWFAASLALWAVVALLLRPSAVRRWFSERRWRSDAIWAVGAAALGVVAVVPVLGSVVHFFKGVGLSAAASGAITTSNVGNLYGRLSPYEIFGLWPSPDFRLDPLNVFHAGELSALAVVVAAYGALWALRQRKFLLLCAVAASLIIWWRTDRTQSPYVSAKALVIGAPLVMGLSLGGLLGRRNGPLSHAALRLAAAAAFCAVALYSTYDEIRHQPVEAFAAPHELAAFEQRIGNSPVLFLGNDEYATWQLRSAAVSALSGYEPSLNAATTRPDKPFVIGQQIDFDSVDPTDLDRFRWVITGSGAYASQAPPNFHLVTGGALYDLWERTGPTVPRQTIEPPGAPGAILDCHSATGKRLRDARGVASVMQTPLTIPGPNFVPGGGSATVKLPLPAGRWELSIPYISSFDFQVSTQGRRWSMPAYLGRQGPFFAVGAVTGLGTASPVTLSVAAQRPSPLTGSLDNLFTYIPVVAATRLPDTRTTVPLSRACGRYVDWYRLT
jgi:hypothetical protein